MEITIYKKKLCSIEEIITLRKEDKEENHGEKLDN